MKNAKDCTHDTLRWGSGDYYLFCADCGRWWAMIDPQTHEVRPTLANSGPGSGNSGTLMVKEK